MLDFLLEIGTEELPPSYLAPAVEALKKGIVDLVEKAGIAAKMEVTGLYASRRMMVFVTGLASRGKDRTEEILGPPADKAFDSRGNPTAAAEGFAKKHKLSPADLIAKETSKGKYCVAMVTTMGSSASRVLAGGLPGIITGLPFPKSMWWGIASDDGRKLTCARPIRYIAAVLDKEIVEFSIGSITSSNIIRGHFFVGKEHRTRKADLDHYIKNLKRDHVFVDQDERRTVLEERMKKLVGSSTFSDPNDLLGEVADMVEYPNILEGKFDERFLELPPEIVEAVLVASQKYFPVRAAGGALESRFLAVFDRPDSADVKAIRRGAERVVEARLEDGAFFYETDKKVHLSARVDALKDQLFHQKLGTYKDKTERLMELGTFIASLVGLRSDEAEKVRQAAKYCKADLVTAMVYEFPGLQGVVGRIYALEEGMDPDVAWAIEEHYRPMPDSRIGKILMIAETFDNIVGYFSVGDEPTSAGDPYGLRRQALNAAEVILTLGGTLAKKCPFSCLIKKAAALHGFVDGNDNVDEEKCWTADITEFISGRLYNYFLDRGHSATIVRAALASGFDDITGLVGRLDALKELSKSKIWDSLTELVERTYKIGNDAELEGGVQPELFTEKQEKEVYRILTKCRETILSLFKQGDYLEGSHLYHDMLAEPVHKFFEDVFVNVEDELVSANRKLLMRDVHDLYAFHVADLSLIPSG